MFRDSAAFDSQVSDVSSLGSYKARVRAAHELADLLKRTRPHLSEQVGVLQAKVTQCQGTLDYAKAQLQCSSTPSDYVARKYQATPTLDRATLTALEEPEIATQALLDLRRQRELAR